MWSSLCVFVTLISTASAFAPSHIGSRYTSSSSSSVTTGSTFLSTYQQRRQRLNKHFDSAAGDLEAARAAFEKLWKQDTLGTPDQMRERYEMLQKRHEREIQLLKSLEHSDDAVKDLLELWSTTIAQPEDSYAVGAATTNTLVRLDPDVLHPASEDIVQHHEAKELRRMADRHPNWAEPCLRLAAYYWRQNDILAAYEWALKGLENQPYHFVASTLFLLLSIQEGHAAEIRHWARMRLPRSFGRRRNLWVHRAIDECQAKWEAQATEIKKGLGVTTTESPEQDSKSQVPAVNQKKRNQLQSKSFVRPSPQQKIIPGMVPFSTNSWYSVDTSNWEAPPSRHYGQGHNSYSGGSYENGNSFNSNWGSTSSGPSTPPPTQQHDWQ